MFYRKNYSSDRKYAVIPIVMGVALAFYGDMSFSTIGVVYTGACVVLAALKAVVGGELLTGDLKLHEMDLLSKMCPIALILIGIVSIMSGEVSAIMGRWEELAVSSAPQVVLLTGVLSFSLNVSSFIANKVTSPLTLCISANVKQVKITIRCAVCKNLFSLVNFYGTHRLTLLSLSYFNFPSHFVISCAGVGGGCEHAVLWRLCAFSEWPWYSDRDLRKLSLRIHFY